MDISQMTRSGKIASAISAQKLKGPDGTLVPFVFFDISSSIILDGEVLDEKAKVLLRGEELCEAFQAGNPKEGDEVFLLGATAYIRNGMLCFRLLDSSQIRHIGEVDSAASRETFGLSREDFVKATKLFESSEK